MTFKELEENTKGIFIWAVTNEKVYNVKKQKLINDYPVYGAFYKNQYYAGFWYDRTFYMFETLDGDDEDFWPDHGVQTLYKSVKQVVKAIPDFEKMIKEGERFMKQIAIEKDFVENEEI